jgi:glutamate-1-semialdehyde 2,1-aminomutase
MAGLAELARVAGVPLAVEATGGMFGFVFSDDGPIRRFSQVAAADTDRFQRFFQGMLEANVYFAPSAFEAGFVSDAHGDNEITQTLKKAEQVFASLMA